MDWVDDRDCNIAMTIAMLTVTSVLETTPKTVLVIRIHVIYDISMDYIDDSDENHIANNNDGIYFKTKLAITRWARLILILVMLTLATVLILAMTLGTIQKMMLGDSVMPM